MKTIALFFFFTYGISDFYAQEGWITDKKKKCQFYTKANSSKRTIKWEGKCVDGFVNGKGVLTIFENDTLKYVIDGNFLNGYTEGQGTCTFKDGNTYVGEWKKGDFNGQGTSSFKDGSSYVGEWKDNVYNGQGTYIFNGEKYVGEWKDGKKDGIGTYTSTNGGSYFGYWKDNKFNGQGTYTMIDGSSYVGDWKDNKFNGQGTYKFKDGDSYVGEWKDNVYNGQGTYKFTDGRSYVGEWKDGKKDGKGVSISSTGKKTAEEYKDGEKLPPKAPLDGEIAIIVSGTGIDFESSRKNALRSAIEQAFGVFVSSNTNILNDELVKDEISTISSGNILSFDILNETILPNGNFVSNLKAIVSIKNLQSYSVSKGATIEFAGGIFGIKIKMSRLNESAEIVAMKNLLLQSKEILKKSVDFTIKAGQPKLYNKSDNYPNDFDVELNVTCTLNDNIEVFNSFFLETLKSIAMSEEEITDYDSLGMKTYSVRAFHFSSDKNIIDKTFYTLRSIDSYIMLKNFFINTNIFLRQFEIVTNMDNWDMENEYFNDWNQKKEIVDFCVGPYKNQHRFLYSAAFPEFYFFLPRSESGFYSFDNSLYSYIDIPTHERRLIFQDHNFLKTIREISKKTEDLSSKNYLWLDIDENNNNFDEVRMIVAQSNSINYFVNKKGDQYFHKVHYIRDSKFMEKIDLFEVRPKNN